MLKMILSVLNLMYIEISLVGIFTMAMCLQRGMSLGISLMIGIIPMVVLWKACKKEDKGLFLQAVMCLIITCCTFGVLSGFLRNLFSKDSIVISIVSFVTTYGIWFWLHNIVRKFHLDLANMQQIIREEKQREKNWKKNEREYKKEQKKAKKERKEWERQEKKRKATEEKIRREDEQRRRQEQQKSTSNENSTGQEKRTESSQKSTNDSSQKSSQNSSDGSSQKSSQGSSSGRTTQRTASSQFDFFAGCRTLDELKSRYKKLASVYHPDNATGNEEIFKNISAEFEKKKKVMA